MTIRHQSVRSSLQAGAFALLLASAFLSHAQDPHRPAGPPQPLPPEPAPTAPPPPRRPPPAHMRFLVTSHGKPAANAVVKVHPVHSVDPSADFGRKYPTMCVTHASGICSLLLEPNRYRITARLHRRSTSVTQQVRGRGREVDLELYPPAGPPTP